MGDNIRLLLIEASGFEHIGETDLVLDRFEKIREQLAEAPAFSRDRTLELMGHCDEAGGIRTGSSPERQKRWMGLMDSFAKHHEG